MDQFTADALHEEGLLLSQEVACSENGTMAIRVRDRGNGVHSEEFSHMFEPCARVGEACERAGSGYGLAITDRAVQDHDDSISAENHSDGGLLVIIRMPEDGHGLSSKR